MFCEIVCKCNRWIITSYRFTTVCCSSFKDKPLVLAPQLPHPIFPYASPILDFSLGDLHPLIELLRHEDFVFVMYYAPWCARSRAAVIQFTKAAQFMEGQVCYMFNLFFCKYLLCISSTKSSLFGPCASVIHIIFNSSCELSLINTLTKVSGYVKTLRCWEH